MDYQRANEEEMKLEAEELGSVGEGNREGGHIILYMYEILKEYKKQNVEILNLKMFWIEFQVMSTLYSV